MWGTFKTNIKQTKEKIKATCLKKNNAWYYVTGTQTELINLLKVSKFLAS